MCRIAILDWKTAVIKSLKLELSIPPSAIGLLALIDAEGYSKLDDHRYSIVITPEEFSPDVSDEANYLAASHDLKMAASKLLDVRVRYENQQGGGFFNIFSYVIGHEDEVSVYIKPNLDAMKWFAVNREFIFESQMKVKGNRLEIHELKIAPLNPFEDMY